MVTFFKRDRGTTTRKRETGLCHAPLFHSLFSLFLFSEKSRDTGWDPDDPSPPSETTTLLSPRPLSVYMPHHALPVGPATASRAWLAVADGGARGISGNPRWGFRMTDGPERMADGVERWGRYSRSGRWFSASAATGCRNHILCLCVLSAFPFFFSDKNSHRVITSALNFRHFFRLPLKGE